jgi:hypothetical protein
MVPSPWGADDAERRARGRCACGCHGAATAQSSSVISHGKLEVLRVSCDASGRDGRYGLARLIDSRGRDAKLIAWLDEIADARNARCRWNILIYKSYDFIASK